MECCPYIGIVMKFPLYAYLVLQNSNIYEESLNTIIMMLKKTMLFVLVSLQCHLVSYWDFSYLLWVYILRGICVFVI